MRVFLFFSVALAVPSCMYGFVMMTYPRSFYWGGNSNSCVSVMHMSSAPSDSATDEEDFSDYGYGAVTVESEAYVATPSETAVTTILDLIPGTSSFSDDVSAEQRAAINEALYKLEALNPTKAPAHSPLLNGVWELRYVGGYSSNDKNQAAAAALLPVRQLELLFGHSSSPGVLSYTLAQQLPKQLVSAQNLEIVISRSQPRVEASIDVSLMGMNSAAGGITVTARLSAESDMRLQETYERATVLGTEVPVPLSAFTRTLYVVYLDEDLMIVRDGSGIPEVLVRKDKKFQKNWGTEPSAVEDMTPPGDGEDAQF